MESLFISTPILDKSDNCHQSIVQDWSIIIPQDNYLDCDDQNMYTCPNTCIHVFKPFRFTYPPCSCMNETFTAATTGDTSYTI